VESTKQYLNLKFDFFNFNTYDTSPIQDKVYKVTRQAFGVETAFIAEYGILGSPIIALLSGI
jgi:hypothetical protein